MNKTFSPGNRREVLGCVEKNGLELTRTPLHVPFGKNSTFAESTHLTLRGIKNKERFNAVGSQCLQKGIDYHLPVLDVDGGASVDVNRWGSKAVLGAACIGTYTPDSNLRDLLGDYAIDLEVFPGLMPKFYRDRSRNEKTGLLVSKIALRSKNPDAFVAVPSTAEGNSHFYIQEPFRRVDQQFLLEEMATLGIVSSTWVGISAKEGMGIVRTPWTEKSSDHYPSS